MYPLHYAKEIVELMLTAHPRGWAVVSDLFYLRQDQIELMFAKDQKCWYEFKKVVKKYDEIVSDMDLIKNKRPRLTAQDPRDPRFPRICVKLWHYLRNADYLESDELDVLLFPLFSTQNYQPPSHQPSST